MEAFPDPLVPYQRELQDPRLPFPRREVRIEANRQSYTPDPETAVPSAEAESDLHIPGRHVGYLAPARAVAAGRQGLVVLGCGPVRVPACRERGRF